MNVTWFFLHLWFGSWKFKITRVAYVIFELNSAVLGNETSNYNANSRLWWALNETLQVQCFVQGKNSVNISCIWTRAIPKSLLSLTLTSGASLGPRSGSLCWGWLFPQESIGTFMQIGSSTSHPSVLQILQDKGYSMGLGGSSIPPRCRLVFHLPPPPQQCTLSYLKIWPIFQNFLNHFWISQAGKIPHNFGRPIYDYFSLSNKVI